MILLSHSGFMPVNSAVKSLWAQVGVGWNSLLFPGQVIQLLKTSHFFTH